MKGLIILFLILTAISGSMLFAGVSVISLVLLKVLFFLFLLSFIVSLITTLFKGV